MKKNALLIIIIFIFLIILIYLHSYFSIKKEVTIINYKECMNLKNSEETTSKLTEFT